MYQKFSLTTMKSSYLKGDKICNVEQRQANITPSRSTGIYILLIVVVLFWGANWPIMKVALTLVEPLTFGALRMIIGAACLFTLLIIIGRFKFPEAGDVRIIVSEAVLHMAAPLALMNIALLHIEAGRSSILSFTTPLWVVPLSMLFLREQLSRLQALGVIVGLSGLLILFGPADMDWTSPNVVLGNMLLLIAALTWAIAILIARTQKWKSSPLQLAPWQMLAAAILMFIPALLFERPFELKWSPQLLAVLAFNGPIASAFCFWAALVAAKELPPVIISMGFLGVPVVGVFFSTITLAEPLTLTLIGGLMLILGGIALVNVGQRKSGKVASR